MTRAATPPAIDVLAFWRDLLAPAVPLLRQGSWGPWQTALRALFALPMDADDEALYRRCTGRQAPPTEPASEGWFCVGRRGGKSFTMAVLAVYLSTVRRYNLAPGERGVLMVIASDRRQARVVRRYIGSILQDVPALRQLVANETKEAIELSNGVDIEIHTASFKTIRGYSVVGAVLDEIAFWPTEDAADPDTEVLKALRPAMATTRGLLVAISTPYARRGELFKTFKRYYGKDSGMLVWAADTTTMNPEVDAAVLERAFEEDPDAAWSEYGKDGEIRFRSDLESFVPREVVEAAVVPGRHELPPLDSVTYSAFVDPSGGSRDSFTLAIGHREVRGGQPVAVVDCLRERKAPFSPEAVVSEFSAVLQTYRVSTITGDRYAGSWPSEAFARHKITYEAAPKPKSDLYRNALAILNAGRIELPDSDRLSAQLSSLERRTARGGRDSIDHPPGGRDDLANAALGLAVALALEPEPVKVRLTWGDTPTPRPVAGRYLPV